MSQPTSPTNRHRTTWAVTSALPAYLQFLKANLLARQPQPTSKLAQLDQLVATLSTRIERTATLAAWYRGAAEGIEVAARIFAERTAP